MCIWATVNDMAALYGGSHDRRKNITPNYGCDRMYRLLSACEVVGQPSVCSKVLICSSTLLGMGVINRVVCNISLWTFIVHNYNNFYQLWWSAIYRKVQFTFSTAFWTYTIGRIIIQSKFNIYLLVLQWLFLCQK